jgi:hypothetical protein
MDRVVNRNKGSKLERTIRDATRSILSVHESVWRTPGTRTSSPSNFDYQIRIEEGKEVPFGPIYYLSEKEFSALREYLDRMLAEGKIAKSDANMGACIIFLSKPNLKLRLCVDYRQLNAVTIKVLYSLPLMEELGD